MRNRIAALLAASMLVATPGLPGMITALAATTFTDATSYAAVELEVGGSTTVEFKITSASDAGKSVTVKAQNAAVGSSDEKVATAKYEDGAVVITAVAAGTATITVSRVQPEATTSTISGSKTITVTVTDSSEPEVTPTTAPSATATPAPTVTVTPTVTPAPAEVVEEEISNVVSGDATAEEVAELVDDIVNASAAQAEEYLDNLSAAAEEAVAAATSDTAVAEIAKNVAEVAKQVAAESSNDAVVTAAVDAIAKTADAALAAIAATNADAVNDVVDAVADVAKAAAAKSGASNAVKAAATNAIANVAKNAVSAAVNASASAAVMDAIVKNAVDNVIATLDAAKIDVNNIANIGNGVEDNLTELEDVLQDAGYGSVNTGTDSAVQGFSVPFGAGLNLGGKKGKVNVTSGTNASRSGGRKQSTKDGKSFNLGDAKKFAIDLQPDDGSAAITTLAIPMKIQVPIAFIGTFNQSLVQVVHFNNDGSIKEFIPVSFATTGFVTFYTTSLSDFAFAEVTDAASTVRSVRTGGSGGGGSSSGGGSVSGSSAATSGSSTTSMPPTEGSWSQREDGSWVFLKTDGTPWQETWIVYGQQWYYVNDQGVCQTGWQLLSGVYYYFSAATVEGQPLGSLYMNKTTPDGYTVDASGAWVQQ